MYKDGLRRAGCHGKRQRKNSDWQISVARSVQSCVEPCSVLFQENGVIRHFLQSKFTAGLVWYLTS